MQPKSMSWTQIRDLLADRIASGAYVPGQKLPTESELSVQLAAGRHSVRRALSALSAEGCVQISQGRGVFVRDGPSFQYTIDRRDRLFEQIERKGHRADLLTIATQEVPASRTVAAALGIDEGQAVHLNEVLLLADGDPLGIGRSFHPLERFPDFREHRRFAPTQRMFYRSFGIPECFRQDTYLWARQASPQEAELLKQHPALPVVETQARDIDPSGFTIGFSTTIWAGSRIRFVVPA